MSDVKLFCRTCNEEVTYQDHFTENEYDYCTTCYINGFRDKLKKIVDTFNKFHFRAPLQYDEYGAGARILDEEGLKIIDFENHLDAETFMELIDEIENWSVNLRGKKEEGQEEKQVEQAK